MQADTDLMGVAKDGASCLLCRAVVSSCRRVVVSLPWLYSMSGRRA
jgi:hypothetical protein